MIEWCDSSAWHCVILMSEPQHSRIEIALDLNGNPVCEILSRKEGQKGTERERQGREVGRQGISA